MLSHGILPWDTDQVTDSNYYILLVTGCNIQLQPTIKSPTTTQLCSISISIEMGLGKSFVMSHHGSAGCEDSSCYSTQSQEIENLWLNLIILKPVVEHSASTRGNRQTRQPSGVFLQHKGKLNSSELLREHNSQ